MKRIAVVFIVSAAFAVPGTVALAAGSSPRPLGAECNITDELGGAVPEAVAVGVLRCGDNRNG